LPRLTYKRMTPDKGKQLVSALKDGKYLEENILCKFEEEKLLDEQIKKYDTSKLNGKLKKTLPTP
ncbi:unnamed protein product, partial [marine sediment metagenome]